MSLPSVLNELNQQPFNIYNLNSQEKEKEIDIKHIMLFTEDFVKIEVGKQYESIIPLFEKMLTKIENLTNEVNELKNKNTKNILDITINEEAPLGVVTAKQDFDEKENIRLEIEETTEFELVENDTEDEEDDEAEEIPAGTKLGGKTWDGDDWETDDEYEDAAEEEDEVVEEEDDEVVVEEEDDEVVEQEDEDAAEEEDEVVEQEDEIVVEEEDSVETEKTDSEEETDEEVQKETETSQEDEDEELFEIDIDDVTYCTNNEENGFIYQLSEDGDVGSKVGYFKEGEPFFYADEN